MLKSLLSFLLVLPLAFGELRAESSELTAKGSQLTAHAAPPVAAWGIDACLSVHVEPASLPEWVALLRQSNVRWLRERNVWTGEGFDPGIRERMETLHAAGFNIVAFAGTPSTVTAQRGENQLPEDLLAVYASGFRQGREFAGLVSAWEMTGEPDVGYCRDLPDRLAAYNKAMYLGLHAGAASVQPGAKSDELGAESSELKANSSQLMAHSSPVVLMGALALPPGPWWERAVDNGLLDYTDAYNFHFYGNAEDLTSVIRAHREAILELRAESLELGAESWELRAGSSEWLGRKRGFGLIAKSSQLTARELPLWLTECGVNATVPGDFLNAERREFQAEFTRATARQAFAARDLAVFMPFILVHRDDPHAMTLPTPPTPLPAWDAYAKLTRETEWPQRGLSVPAGEKARVYLGSKPAHRSRSTSEVRKQTGPALPSAAQAAGLPPHSVALAEPSSSHTLARLSSQIYPNPVVVQWMPTEGTVSHKVAGTYRVGSNEVMTGEFRIYNFGERAVIGELSGGAGIPEAGAHAVRRKPEAGGLEIGNRASQSDVAGHPDRRTLRSNVAVVPEAGLHFFTAAGRATRVSVNIPAGGCVTVPAIYTPGTDTGYFREWLKAGFREASGRVSPVAFGVERQPEAADFVREPVAVYPLRGDSRVRPPEVNVEGVAFGPWRVFNELEAKSYELTAKSYELAGGTWFSVAKPVNDPLAPTYALGALRGVPEGARFLRVKLDRPMVRTAAVRVDLVDADGERFTIWENLGNPYGGSSREVWLGLEDFHPYFWSKAVAGNRRLRPDKVREISLRFYLTDGGAMDVELEWMRERSAR